MIQIDADYFIIIITDFILLLLLFVAALSCSNVPLGQRLSPSPKSKASPQAASKHADARDRPVLITPLNTAQGEY